MRNVGGKNLNAEVADVEDDDKVKFKDFFIFLLLAPGPVHEWDQI